MDLHGTGMRILVGFLLVLLLLLIGAMIACNHNPFSCSCELVRFLNVSHTDLNIVTSLESAQTMPAITAGGTAQLGEVGKTLAAFSNLKLSPHPGA
jgi:hypothetical protein